jgi:hypothetical protein
MVGTACSAMLINWTGAQATATGALPLLLEAALLLSFGLLGTLVKEGPGLVLVGHLCCASSWGSRMPWRAAKPSM